MSIIKNKLPKTFVEFFLIFALSLLCFACQNKQVEVLNHSKSFYGKNNNYNKEKYLDLENKPISSVLRNHQIQVEKNETVYSVSRRYQVPLRDLIKQNNLNPPYKLNIGDKLIIPAPAYHTVAAGDTFYSIARLYKMNMDSLATMNDFKPPYNLIIGQKVRIAKFNEVEEIKNTKTLNQEDSNEDDDKKSNNSVGFVEKTLDKFNHFSWPLRGEIISKFGPKLGGLYNDGINIKAKEGEIVKAAEDGIVSYAGNELKGYGNLIIVKHSGGWITAYAHLSKISVKRGQKVTKFSKIGEVGSTGNVSSPQLYFGLRKGHDAVNPENYLSR